jgi:hypothetical protein
MSRHDVLSIVQHISASNVVSVMVNNSPSTFEPCIYAYVIQAFTPSKIASRLGASRKRLIVASITAACGLLGLVDKTNRTQQSRQAKLYLPFV